MKYVYDGEYCEFRGRVFAWRHPVDITDRGTLEAIARNPSFKKYPDDVVLNTEFSGKPRVTTVIEKVDYFDMNPDACPKCGRTVTQGKYLHIKFCKGKP